LRTDKRLVTLIASGNRVLQAARLQPVRLATKGKPFPIDLVIAGQNPVRLVHGGDLAHMTSQFLPVRQLVSGDITVLG
jgi:hypothetical protein